MLQPKRTATEQLIPKRAGAAKPKKEVRTGWHCRSFFFILFYFPIRAPPDQALSRPWLEQENFDETSEAYVFNMAVQVDDSEWPDPVRSERDLAVRAVGDGETKLVVTIYIPDRTSKKLATSDAFTFMVR